MITQVFGGDSDEEDLPNTQGSRDNRQPGKSSQREEDEDIDDEFDFIVDDHGQPIRRRKEDGTFTEP